MTDLLMSYDYLLLLILQVLPLTMEQKNQTTAYYLQLSNSTYIRLEGEINSSRFCYEIENALAS